MQSNIFAHLKMLIDHLDYMRFYSPEQQAQAMNLLEYIAEKRNRMLASNPECRESLEVSTKSTQRSSLVSSQGYELQRLEAKISEQAEAIRVLKQQNNAYQSYFGQLAEEIQTLRAERTRLKKRVEDLEQKGDAVQQ